jgi:sugar phosphate isomerase/epimerase
MQEDFVGSIKKVSEAGYTGVEFAGYYGMESAEVKKILDDSGLITAGSHDSIELLKRDLGRAIDYALEIGNRYIICPYNPEFVHGDADSFRKAARLFNEIGEKCRRSGIRFGYHNHNFEFRMIDGQYGLDILLENTEPGLVFFEIDTYWVQFAGLNPVEVIEKYKERCPLLHIKEMKSHEDKVNTIIGKGVMDFKGIVSTGKKYNVDWYVVEQEYFEDDLVESVKAGCKYLESIL